MTKDKFATNFCCRPTYVSFKLFPIQPFKTFLFDATKQ